MSTWIGLDAIASHTLILHMAVTTHISDLKQTARVHELAVFVPVDGGWRIALGLAEQCHILLLRRVNHNRVRRVVADKGWRSFINNKNWLVLVSLK